MSDVIHDEKDITSRDIANVMLGKRLKTSDVIATLERLHGACDRRLVRNRIINMSLSKNANMEIIGNERVKTWHLISIDECYFRQSSITRHVRRGKPAIVKEKHGRTYPRPKMKTEEVNICRLAKAVQTAWLTGVWINPVLEGEVSDRYAEIGVGNKGIASGMVEQRRASSIPVGIYQFAKPCGNSVSDSRDRTIKSAREITIGAWVLYYIHSSNLFNGVRFK